MKVIICNPPFNSLVTNIIDSPLTLSPFKVEEWNEFKEMNTTSFSLHKENYAPTRDQSPIFVPKNSHKKSNKRNKRK